MAAIPRGCNSTSTQYPIQTFYDKSPNLKSLSRALNQNGDRAPITINWHASPPPSNKTTKGWI